MSLVFPPRTGVHRTPTPTGRVAQVACVRPQGELVPTRPPPGYVHCPRVPRAKDGGHQGGCLLLVSRHARTLCSRPRPVKNNCQCRIGPPIRNCQMPSTSASCWQPASSGVSQTGGVTRTDSQYGNYEHILVSYCHANTYRMHTGSRTALHCTRQSLSQETTYAVLCTVSFTCGCPSARPVKGHAPDPENAQPSEHRHRGKASWVVSAALVQQTGGDSHQAPRKTRVPLTSTLYWDCHFLSPCRQFHLHRIGDSTRQTAWVAAGKAMRGALQRAQQRVAQDPQHHGARRIHFRDAPSKGLPKPPREEHCMRQKS